MPFTESLGGEEMELSLVEEGVRAGLIAAISACVQLVIFGTAIYVTYRILKRKYPEPVKSLEAVLNSLVKALQLLSSTINGLKTAVDTAASLPGNAKNAVVGAVGNVKDKGGDAIAAGMGVVHRAIGAVRKKPIDSGGGSEGGP